MQEGKSAVRLPRKSESVVTGACRKIARGRCAAAILALAAATGAYAAAGGSEQRPAETRDGNLPSRSAGLLAVGQDGRLRTAGAARIGHRAGAVDKLGSFAFGLGYGAPDYDSAALCLVGLNARGEIDPGFGTGGSVVTPLLPLANRDRATVTALLTDAQGRMFVVGWRTLSTRLDANFLVLVVARYTAAGVLDSGFGDGGIVTTRIERDDVTQALAATLDDEGRLLVAGYNGGRNRERGRDFDDWPIRVVVLRYTAGGVLDHTFGTGGIAAHVLVPGKPKGHAGRDFLYYDREKTKSAALTLDRQGRSVVAASSDEGPIVLLRHTRAGVPDASFGKGGVVETPLGTSVGISSFVRSADGRLLLAGTSDRNAVLLRYSADGALDASFGDGGIRRTSIGEGMRVSAALAEADGHLLVVASGNRRVTLARYDRDGRPDLRHGSSGAIVVDLDKTVATAAGLAVDDTGTPVVTVSSENGMFLLRFRRGAPVEVRFHAVPPARS